MKKWILWAQALDNNSPDHIEISNGNESREAAVATVYRVIEKGKNIYSSDRIKLTASRDEVVLEIMSSARDQVGRSAPIICCTRYGHSVPADFDAQLDTAVSVFAASIDRSLAVQIPQEIKSAVDALKKNLRTAARFKLLMIAAIVLALIAAVCATRYTGPSEQYSANDRHHASGLSPRSQPGKAAST